MSNFSYQNTYNDGTGLWVSSGTSAATSSVPVGTIVMFCSTVLPHGWIACEGQEVSRGGIYAPLYDVIGTNFNTLTTPSDKFAVPDLRGRFPIGYDVGGYSGAFANSQPTKGSAAQSKKIDANQLPTHSHSKGTLAVSDTTATNQDTTATNQATTATNQSTTAVNQSTTATNQSITATNQSTTAVNQVKQAVNQDAELDTSDLEDHQHNYKHIHFNEHTHEKGTIAYTQNAHDHEMLLHTHDISPHTHPLNRQGYTDGNWAFPFKYNNIGSSSYNGFWYSRGNIASANGATAAYYPQTVLPQENAGTTETGNSNTDNTAVKTATGSMAGDTAGQDGTSGAVASHTSSSKSADAPYNTDNYTEYSYHSMTIPDHTHTQNSHGHTQDPHNHTQVPHYHTQDAHTHTQDAHNHTQHAHNHTQDAHGHTQNAHTHTQDAHNHLQDAHNHTQNAHNHTQDAHNHTQDSHNHTQDAHTHTQNAHNHLQDAHNHLQDAHGHTLTGDTGNNTSAHNDFQPPLLCLIFMIKYSAS